jgi:hypothetical protein
MLKWDNHWAELWRHSYDLAKLVIGQASASGYSNLLPLAGEGWPPKYYLLGHFQPSAP